MENKLKFSILRCLADAIYGAVGLFLTYKISYVVFKLLDVNHVIAWYAVLLASFMLVFLLLGYFLRFIKFTFLCRHIDLVASEHFEHDPTYGEVVKNATVSFALFKLLGALSAKIEENMVLPESKLLSNLSELKPIKMLVSAVGFVFHSSTEFVYVIFILYLCKTQSYLEACKGTINFIINGARTFVQVVYTAAVARVFLQITGFIVSLVMFHRVYAFNLQGIILCYAIATAFAMLVCDAVINPFNIDAVLTKAVKVNVTADSIVDEVLHDTAFAPIIQKICDLGDDDFDAEPTTVEENCNNEEQEENNEV